MEKTKRLLIGLLTLLLVAYAAWTTIRINKLQVQLDRLEKSYRQLQVSQAALAVALLHSDGSAEAAARAKVEIIRESLGLPSTLVLERSPATIQGNAIPRHLKSK
jgi:hypothetical protein